jgi:hypothetical protein
MRLQTSSKSFPKFSAVGDKFSGTFVSFEQDVSGKFGPESVVVLEKDGIEQRIRCPASLVRTLNDHRDHLIPGSAMVLEYVRDIPTSKGNPAKIIEVDIEPPAAGFRAQSDVSDADEDAPFS